MGARNDEEDAWRIRLGSKTGGRMLQGPPYRSFAILRCAKIKTLGNMGASLQHTFRERDTPNADTRRTPTTPSWSAATTAKPSSMPGRTVPLRRSAAMRSMGWNTLWVGLQKP